MPRNQEEDVISHPASGARGDRTEQLLRVSGILALLWVALITFSIAGAEGALWLSAATFGVAWLVRELDPGALPAQDRGAGPAGDVLARIGAPIIAFFTVSFISAFVSRERFDSLFELREVFLFAAPLVTWAVFRDPRMRDRGREAFAFGIFAAVLIGIYQTATLEPAPGDIVFRASGPLGHYMTFSGVLLAAVPLLLTLRGRLQSIAGQLTAALAVAMIGLTFTRSAWIGAVVALSVFLATGWTRPATGAADGGTRRRGPAAVAATVIVGLVLVAVVLGAIAGSDALYDRASSIFSLEDPSNKDRLAMAATGLEIIAAHPWLGIGPGVMESVYPAWAVEWRVNAENPHLHNNVLQIAAERGLIGLAAWLWIIAAFALASWRVLRAAGPTGPGGPEARAALAALAGFLAMGTFEYNFSDSEVLMAVLFVISLPLAASAPQAEAVSADPSGGDRKNVTGSSRNEA